MIKLLLDILLLINNVIPLFFSIAVFAFLAILLAKSIKRHARIYYTVLAVPFVLTLVPFFLNMMGMDLPRLNRLPILSYFMRDYVHMATLGFPLLIIIMYMGALDVRNPYVARLMSIRKELSIIVGFPVLTHATLRAFNTFPTGWKFFFAHDDYMAEEHVSNILGAGISSFVFVLGIVMLALFLILWITSFTAVRRRMGYRRWKRVQRWAYVLYGMLFIHSIGLQVGGLLNSKEKQNKPRIEMVAKGEPAKDKHHYGGLGEIEIDTNIKRYIHISSVVLIFGSYLILRVRKASRSHRKA